MVRNIREKDHSRDYYEATLENGSPVMKPHCACGELLDDNYYCDKCSRRCRCSQIRCDNEMTLELVNRYIKKSPQFSGFTARLANND